MRVVHALLMSLSDRDSFQRWVEPLHYTALPQCLHHFIDLRFAPGQNTLEGGTVMLEFFITPLRGGMQPTNNKRSSDVLILPAVPFPPVPVAPLPPVPNPELPIGPAPGKKPGKQLAILQSCKGCRKGIQKG
jgi:hypothetical protein